MNGFLWLGVGCTLLLIVSVVFDGLDDLFDAFDFAPAWLSLPVIAGFLGAFGFAAGALHTSWGAPALAVGVLAGVGFGWFAARLSAAAINMPTGRTDSQVHMLGSLGRIVTAPIGTRYGEVLLDRPAGPVKVACTAATALPAGTEVVVVDVASPTLVAVEAFDPSGASELGA